MNVGFWTQSNLALMCTVASVGPYYRRRIPNFCFSFLGLYNTYWRYRIFASPTNCCVHYWKVWCRSLDFLIIIWNYIIRKYFLRLYSLLSMTFPKHQNNNSLVKCSLLVPLRTQKCVSVELHFTLFGVRNESSRFLRNTKIISFHFIRQFCHKRIGILVLLVVTHYFSHAGFVRE